MNRQQELEAIARRVYALKAITASTSHSTRRSQNTLIKELNDNDLTTVAEMVLTLQEKNRAEISATRNTTRPESTPRNFNNESASSNF
jgi:hypothetical protein